MNSDDLVVLQEPLLIVTFFCLGKVIMILMIMRIMITLVSSNCIITIFLLVNNRKRQLSWILPKN